MAWPVCSASYFRNRQRCLYIADATSTRILVRFRYWLSRRIRRDSACGMTMCQIVSLRRKPIAGWHLVAPCELLYARVTISAMKPMCRLRAPPGARSTRRQRRSTTELKPRSSGHDDCPGYAQVPTTTAPVSITKQRVGQCDGSGGPSIQLPARSIAVQRVQPISPTAALNRNHPKVCPSSIGSTAHPVPR